MLDPQRIGLNAASVGFLKRTGQNVDWASFNQALQTDDSRCADVRAEMETPVDELHVMGGQRFGLEGNSNLKMNARQERQMNGYPLRSFSANAPAIILPDKYGGLPMYTRNQTEYSDFVSRYTAPLSTALQNDTVLLGRQGYSVTNESASHPYRDVGFEHNMHKSKDAIDYNEAAIKQRQWLQYQSQVARKQKRGGKVTEMRMSSKNGRGVKNAVDGIFISANGEPMTLINNDSLGQMAYEAEIETRPPTMDPHVPGTDMLDPSVDESAQFLPAQQASRAIAAGVISGGRRENESDYERAKRMIAAAEQESHNDYVRYRVANKIRSNALYPLQSAFNKLWSNSRYGEPPKKREVSGMEGADLESRAEEIVFRTAAQNQVQLIQSVQNTDIAITSRPLISQQNQNISVGQARGLYDDPRPRWGLSTTGGSATPRTPSRLSRAPINLSPDFGSAVGQSVQTPIGKIRQVTGQTPVFYPYNKTKRRIPTKPSPIK